MIVFITAGCLEYNISDPSNGKKKKGLLATKICSVYIATCQMYLFVCLNHFYCEKKYGFVVFFFFFFFFVFFRCNENEAIVVVAINRQYLHAVHLVRKYIYMMDNYLYRPMFV